MTEIEAKIRFYNRLLDIKNQFVKEHEKILKQLDAHINAVREEIEQWKKAGVT